MEGENMNKAYVEWRDEGYWIANSRVSLDTIVYAFLDGQSPEAIAQSLPVLTLEQVYGSIAFYLAHQPEVETYLEKSKADFETKRKASRESDPVFYQKLADCTASHSLRKKMTRPLKDKAIERLRKALDPIKDLKQRDRGSPEFEKWHRDTEIAIANTFGDDSRNVKDFTNISFFLGTQTSSTTDSDRQRAYISGLESATAILLSMIDEIEEYWEDDSLTGVSTSDKKTNPEHLRNVFIIHGHDEGTKETVARFISQIQLNPIILHEQPNQGQTIIEKFEQHAEVAFAVALLTPDDTGSLAGEEQSHQPRARQNVIFEFGYFMGKLGRQRVCALTKGKVETPSDYDGVIYISFDKSGAWKMELVKELKNAGFEVDANLAF